jgi:glutamate formiminotransferase
MALLAYPNVSEGRDHEVIDEIVRGFGVGVLDVHSDVDHHRTAVTLTGRPGELARTVASGAARAVELLTLSGHDGVHPRVGVLDVAAIVWTDPSDRGAACAEALVLADRLASELALPVLLYGALGGGRSRADLRRGGPGALARRLACGELVPDFGPRRAHPTAGVTLVAARPPLVAFNVELADGQTLQDARSVAALIREGGVEGLPGVRAIGVWLATRGVAQVSTNLEDLDRTRPAEVLAAVARHATVVGAELVGLAPAAALGDLPTGIPLRGRATIEDALTRASTL